MKKHINGKIISVVLLLACVCICLGPEGGRAQMTQPAATDAASKNAEVKQAAPGNAAADPAVKKEPAAISVDAEGKLGVPLHSRNPLEAGINVHTITSRAFINYHQIDVAGGVFFPMGDLAGGMDLGYSFGINVRTPFTHLVMPSMLGGWARYFGRVDVGLHFSYLSGESSRNSGDEIVFAPMLLDIYYTPPLETGRFKFYVYNGLGVSLASTVVVRNSVSVHEQSFDFTIRPGLGAEYFFNGRVYARLNAGYFVCLESVVAMGSIISLGAGYLY